MLKIEVTGLEAVRELLDGFSERRLRSAGATALTRAARAIGDAWTGQLTDRIDRPTAKTARAVRVLRAENTSAAPEATVKLRDSGTGTPPVAWLSELERGGQRRVKKFEAMLQAAGVMPPGWKAVPGPAAKIDGNGNVSRRQLVALVDALARGGSGASRYGRVAGGGARSRTARAAKPGAVWVAIAPGNPARLTPGAYLREGRNLRAVLLFVSSAHYRKQLDLLAVAQREAPRIVAAELQRAVEESAARLARRIGR